MEDDNNIFDKDDVLDFMIYEDIEKESKSSSGKNDCLGVCRIMITAPTAGKSYKINISF